MGGRIAGTWNPLCKRRRLASSAASDGPMMIGTMGLVAGVPAQRGKCLRGQSFELGPSSSALCTLSRSAWGRGRETCQALKLTHPCPERLSELWFGRVHLQRRERPAHHGLRQRRGVDHRARGVREQRAEVARGTNKTAELPHGFAQRPHHDIDLRLYPHFFSNATALLENPSGQSGQHSWIVLSRGKNKRLYLCAED